MKIFYTLIFILPLLIFGCDKDKSIEKKIAGTWAIDQLTGRTFLINQGTKVRIVDIIAREKGAMAFNIDNKGYINYPANGVIVNSIITNWANYNDTLAISFKDQEFFLPEVAKFTFKEIGSNTLELRYNAINKASIDSTFEYSFYIRLKRKY